MSIIVTTNVACNIKCMFRVKLGGNLCPNHVEVNIPVHFSELNKRAILIKLLVEFEGSLLP
jgi:hypothetical protein